MARNGSGAHPERNAGSSTWTGAGSAGPILRRAFPTAGTTA